MGLDIMAYSNMTLVPTLGPHKGSDGWCEDEKHVTAFAYECFPRSFLGLAGADRTFEQQFIGGYCYAMTASTETLGFRAGSYGGHFRFRMMLGELIGKPAVGHDLPDVGEEDPFYELIFFADNEGTIGPVASVELLADFRTWRDAFVARFDTRDVELYDDWTRAFELAAQSGLVCFH